MKTMKFVADGIFWMCLIVFSACVVIYTLRARFLPWEQQNGQKTLILHLGDHDPSGIDMSRDIQDRLHIFGCATEVKRIALNMDQVREHNPPPNPAKLTDSRCEGYVEKFGEESWELDALPPDLLGEMINNEVFEVRDLDVWQASEAREKEMKDQLKICSAMWPEVSKLLPKLNRGERFSEKDIEK